MKLILYYLSLLVFIAVVTGFLLSQSQTDPMSMHKMLGVSAALAVYAVAMSLVGEGSKEDERGILHRHIANRIALIAGVAIISIGILYQMFVLHQLDYWLLISLIVINFSKIVSLIYLNYRK